MGQSSPKLVTWAAQDGRVQDLVYHINTCGPNGLKPAPGSEKKRAPLHFAAIGGYIECISILYDAGGFLLANVSCTYNILSIIDLYNKVVVNN